MSFIESPRFPDAVGFWARGGPGYTTTVVVVNSGYESRNAVWQASRATYDISNGLRTPADVAATIAFFRIAKGRANGFRFKDFNDYAVSTGQGIFQMLTPTTFQMQKQYTSGAGTDVRTITKPVSGTVVITGGVTPVVDYTTGIVTVASGTPTSWTGEFDVPVRFDTDQMRGGMDNGGLYTWESIPIVEIRI